MSLLGYEFRKYFFTNNDFFSFSIRHPSSVRYQWFVLKAEICRTPM